MKKYIIRDGILDKIWYLVARLLDNLLVPSSSLLKSK